MSRRRVRAAACNIWTVLIYMNWHGLHALCLLNFQRDIARVTVTSTEACAAHDLEIKNRLTLGTSTRLCRSNTFRLHECVELKPRSRDL